MRIISIIWRRKLRKVYLLFLMLIGIFYWVVVLDQADAVGKPIPLLMILICLLVEILLIKRLRKESFEIPLHFRFFMDLINGIEWLIFFCFVIKSLSSNSSFFESRIEMQTLFFILTMSLLVVPMIVRSKKKHQSMNLKVVLFILLGFIIIDRGIIYLELHHYLPQIYASNTVRFATTNLSILMYVTWIVNVEFIKKQFILSKD